MGEFDIRAPRGAVKKKKMLGRGTGTGYGSTAGRGTKGQKSRSGGGVRPGFEGGQMPLFRRVARRGFSNYPFKKSYVIVSLDKLEKYRDGETVNIDTLVDKGIIKSKKKAVKILANGTLTKKITVENLKVSKKAKEAIESLGGKVKNQEEEAGEKIKTAGKEKTAVNTPEKTSASEPVEKSVKDVKKPAVKKVTEKKATEKKPAVKKTAEKKTEVKKAAEKKSAVKKADTKVAKSTEKAVKEKKGDSDGK